MTLYKTIKKLFIIALVFSLLVTACKKENAKKTDDNTTVELPTIIPSTTKIIDQAMNNELAKVDSNQLVFVQGSTYASKFSVGDVLVSDITANAEFGFLRKVIGVKTVGGQIILETENASLTDAIEQASVTFHKDFDDTDILSVDSSGSLKTAMTFQAIKINKILYDGDGDKSTTIDQVKATGYLNLDPSFDFTFDVSGFKLKKMLADVSLKASSSLKITAGGSANTNIVQYNLCYFFLKPFAVPIATPLGTFPIIVYPHFVVSVGLDGKITSVLTAQVNNVFKAKGGLRYDNGVWSTVVDTSNVFTYVKPKFTQKVSLTAYLEPRMDFFLYDNKDLKNTIAIKGYFRGEAQTSPDSIFQIYAGVEADASILMKVFDKTIADKSMTIYNDEKLLWEGPDASDSLTIIKYLTNASTRSWKVDSAFYLSNCCKNLNALDVATFNANGEMSYYYGRPSGCSDTCAKTPDTDPYPWTIKRSKNNPKNFVIYWSDFEWAEIRGITPSRLKITLTDCCQWYGQGANYPVEYVVK